MSKYHYLESLGDMRNPDTILGHVLKLVDVGSAADIGCGVGTWTESLRNYGVEKVLALDAEWFDAEILKKHIRAEDFVCHNLDDGVYHSREKYDLALCLEVAEHIAPENELNVVETLVGLSDVILFSAAIPGQGGDGHVNEQWPSHWRELFRRYGYEFLDVVRPYIWTNKFIHKWYRQNTFLVVKKKLTGKIWDRFTALELENQMLDVVHPEYWKK